MWWYYFYFSKLNLHSSILIDTLHLAQFTNINHRSNFRAHIYFNNQEGFNMNLKIVSKRTIHTNFILHSNPRIISRCKKESSIKKPFYSTVCGCMLHPGIGPNSVLLANNSFSFIALSNYVICKYIRINVWCLSENHDLLMCLIVARVLFLF